VVGVGLCSPGRVEPDSGYVRGAVNLGWDAVDVRAGLRRRLRQPDLPLWLQKDANALALGEMAYGAARGARDFVYLAVGTGLGGGAVANGQVISGAAYNPTEIGHLSLDPGGRTCICGQRGCAEMYCSGVGFLAALRERRAEFPVSVLAAREDAGVPDLLTAAGAGDPLALAVLREGGQWLGAIMACLAAVLNPALIVVGGGLGHAAAGYLLPEAEHELKRRVLPPTFNSLKLVLSQVPESALGAAALVWLGAEAGGRPPAGENTL
jgi:glucokinase